MNDLLLELTAGMPMKQINFDFSKLGVDHSKPYLQRYFAGNFRDGVDLWLNRFLSNDGYRHLHSHPFEFNSVIINGGYKEEFLAENGQKVVRSWDAKGYINEVLPDILKDLGNANKHNLDSFCFLACARTYSNVGVFDWHRIAEVQPETWTAVLVKKQRLPKWYFKSDDGDLVDMVASPRDWHKRYKVRPESGIALDDNAVRE